MSRENETKKRGRPEGKNYVPVSLNVTREQYHFIKSKWNSSEYFRRLFDVLIALQKLIPERNRLQEITDKFTNEPDFNYFEFDYSRDGWEDGKHFKYKLDEKGDPIPKNEGGEVLLKQWKEVKENLEKINAQVEQQLAELNRIVNEV